MILNRGGTIYTSLGAHGYSQPPYFPFPMKDKPPFHKPGSSGSTGTSATGHGQRKHLGLDRSGDAYPAEPRRKSFRPIWDRANDAAKVDPTPLAPRPIMPPPASMFSRPRTPLNVTTLPSFNQFVPPNLVEQGRQFRDAQDQSDAMTALQALMRGRK
jgi:hypothetical protein